MKGESTMNAKQKRTLIKAVTVLVLLGLLWLAVFFNWPVGLETHQFIVDQNAFAVDFVTNFQTNYMFYLLIAGVALVGYLLATKKRR